jgi:hypothetical protein
MVRGPAHASASAYSPEVAEIHGLPGRALRQADGEQVPHALVLPHQQLSLRDRDERRQQDLALPVHRDGEPVVLVNPALAESKTRALIGSDLADRAKLTRRDFSAHVFPLPHVQRPETPPR